MSRYVLVRGWIECAFDDVPKVREIVKTSWSRHVEYGISSQVADLYAGGWVFPEKPINWVSFVFYGASMQEMGSYLVKDTLSAIAAINSDIGGLFHVDDEEKEVFLEWRLEGRVVVEKKSSAIQ